MCIRDRHHPSSLPVAAASLSSRHFGPFDELSLAWHGALTISQRGFVGDQHVNHVVGVAIAMHIQLQYAGRRVLGRLHPHHRRTRSKKRFEQGTSNSMFEVVSLVSLVFYPGIQFPLVSSFSLSVRKAFLCNTQILLSNNVRRVVGSNSYRNSFENLLWLGLSLDPIIVFSDQ